MSPDVFPKHECALHLEHNPNRSYYETVEQYLESLEQSCTDWINEEEKVAAIKASDVWVLRWYPITPIGSHTLAAHNLDTLLKTAKELGNG